MINDIQNFNSYIGYYVLVNYSTRLYTGILEKVSETPALIKCMKKAGKQNENIFIWLKRVQDCKWYDLVQIIGIIPEPNTISESHRFSLNQNVWNYCFMKV